MNASSFPPPTGPYKVWINKNTNWQDFRKIRIQISMNNPRYEGDKFRALMEWCTHRFDDIELIVSDTLHRHNLRRALDISPAMSWKIARAQGTSWLDRNYTAGRIVRWDDLLNNEDYFTERRRIDALYDGDTAFRAAVDDKCAKFGVAEFLLEEIAVFAFMFRTPAVDLYAGSWVTDIIEAAGNACPHALSVDLVRNKAFAAVTEAEKAA